MIKVVNEEVGNLQSNKAKNILRRLKAGAMAFAIMVGSMVGMHSTKAEELFLFENPDGEFVAGEAAPEGYTGESVVFSNDLADVNATIANPDDIQSVLLQTLDDAFVWEEFATQPLEEESLPEVPEEAPEVLEETVEPVVEEQPVNDFALLYNVPDSSLASEAPEVEETIEEVEEDYYPTEEVVIPDREEDLLKLDILVNDDYTGVAPVDFVGEDKVLHNYGDASNDEEVRERATAIYNHIHRINEERGYIAIGNMQLGFEYSIEDIMNIIKYINGAYVASTGAEAKYMNDYVFEFLNAIRNDEHVIEDVTYKAGEEEEICQEDIINHENVLEKFDYCSLIMGDSITYPFMRWFSDKINEMYSATTREEAIEAFDEAYRALMALVEGPGFVINNRIYTIEDFSRPSDIVLLIEVCTSSIMRNEFNAPGYKMDKKYVGTINIYLTRVLDEFSALCSDELEAQLRTDGVDIFEGVVEYEDGSSIGLHNYASVFQMKVFNEAITNGTMGIENYQNKYLYKYPEYLAIQEGTYEGLELEPELVYRKR